uniref:Small ribosomal subunit protein uS3c n=1 Tax=Prasinococcus sp. CCMP1194 TaxID=110672 RepID=A0A088CIZ5_9VIRI|nr:ribosomal protein S3 [Prasinococcus sp. CCMP1194]
MGQKVHPTGFRLQLTQNYLSDWSVSVKRKDYSTFVKTDFIIRKTLFSSVPPSVLQSVVIHQLQPKIQVFLHTTRPSSIIGQKGVGLDFLRKKVKKTLSKEGLLIKNQRETFLSKKQEKSTTRELSVFLHEIPDSETNATFIAETIAAKLEKRIAFKRAMRQAIQKARRANIDGIKVQISGRLNGAEIARSEWVREGQVPLQTLRAPIDYCQYKAHTIYGVLGIKVWVYKKAPAFSNSSSIS